MGPSLHPSSVAVLSIAADKHHQYHPLSTDDDDEEEDDEFEFKPLLLHPRVGAHIQQRPTSRAGHRVAAANANARSTVTHHQRARRRAPHPHVSAAAANKAEQQQQAPVPPPPRRVRWHHMAFGSVRVPSAMDMGEIRRRLEARQQAPVGGGLANGRGAVAAAAGWAPAWRLIRSLSCKGVEAVAVAAVAAPVRLV